MKALQKPKVLTAPESLSSPCFESISFNFVYFCITVACFCVYNNYHKLYSNTLNSFNISVIQSLFLDHFSQKLEKTTLIEVRPTTLASPIFNSLQAMVINYSHAKVQSQWSVGSKDRVETNGQTEVTALHATLIWSVMMLHELCDCHSYCIRSDSVSKSLSDQLTY